MSTTTDSETLAEVGEQTTEQQISTDSDGQPLGVNLFITAEELQTMGVDPRGQTVEYRVHEGGVLVTPVDG